MSGRPPPLVIGASGGSGTRVFQRIAEHAGYFMGFEDRLNKARDARPFFPMFGWLPEVVPAWLDDIPEASPEMAARYGEWEQEHLKGAPAGRWGWKLPTSMLVLPLLHHFRPGMSFIHVVRDGRDMALSRNRRQFRILADVVLDTPDPRHAVRAAQFWARVNTLVADYGEAHMGGRYLRIRFEELCSEPRATVARIVSFIEGDTAGIDPSVAEVRTPSSVGRWRLEPRKLRRAIDDACSPALRRFGYKPGDGGAALIPRDALRGARRTVSRVRRAAKR